MKKIKLSLDTLRIESFATDTTKQETGTVVGAAKTTIYDTCGACLSFIDACPSSPPAQTLPCNGCQGTELC